MVWLGRDVLLDRAVAVKEIIQPANDETYQRALREARAAARVKHPGVAAVYDVVSEDGRWYIVMELVEGRPLSEVIDAEGPLPPAIVADIGGQILAALEVGHAAGVLHRDLKPSNVLITPAGRAVVTDFGIASVAGDPSITRTGIVLGTPGYLAPERASGEAATVAADLWALGATLFAAAEGHGPFDSYTEVMAMMVAVISTDPPAPTVAEPLAGIISALMSRDPMRRPSTRATAHALESVAAAGLAGPGPTPTAVAGIEPVYGYETPSWQAAEPSWQAAEPSWQAAEPSWRSAEPSWRSASGHTRELYDSPDTASGLLQPVPARGRGDASRSGRGASRSGRGGSRSGDGAFRSGGGAGWRTGGRKPVVAIVGVAIAAVVAVSVILIARPASPKAQYTSSSVLQPIGEQFRVTPVVAADGNPSLFARDKTGHLVTSHFANGAWSAWSTVPGSPVITGVPAATVSNGQMSVVVRDQSTGFADYMQQNASGSWQAPVKIGTSQVTSSVAALQVGGLLEAYARLPNHQLGFAMLTNGTWSDWKGLGGNLASAPIATLDNSGNPNVFAVAALNTLVQDVYVGGHWTGITTLPGNNYSGQPAVGTNPDSRLELYIDTTGGIVVNVWQQPGHLTQWGGPQTRVPAVASEPAVTNESSNRLEVFAVSSVGAVLHSGQNTPYAGTSWSTPAPIGASFTGAPAVLHLGGGNEELFVRTQAGTIAVSVRSANTGQGDWSTPVPINGNF